MNSVVVDGMAEAQFFFILPPNCHMPDDNRAVQKETIQNNGGQVPADKYGLAKPLYARRPTPFLLNC